MFLFMQIYFKLFKIKIILNFKYIKMYYQSS